MSRSSFILWMSVLVLMPGMPLYGQLTLPYTGTYTGPAASAFSVVRLDDGYAMWALATGPNSYGVHGRCTSPTGVTYGVTGYSASRSGTGVYGASKGIGVYGRAYASGGIGVKAHSFAPTEVALQVWGQSTFSETAVFNGNVGIGTSAPVGKLQIKGGDLVFEDASDSIHEIRNAYDLWFHKDTDNDNSAAWFDFRTNEDIEQFRIEDGDEAAILGDGTFYSNGLDYAEAFKIVESDLEPGDVVSLAIGRPEYCLRSAAAYDPALLGVVSARPSFVAGASFDQESAADPQLAQQRDEARAAGDHESEKELTLQLAELVKQTHRPIAMMGRVPCKVVGEINAGDYLTSSTTPGHAMRQTQAGPSVGIALQDWAGAGAGEIWVLVRPGWYGGGGAPIGGSDIAAAPAAAPASEVLSEDVAQLARQLQQKEEQVKELSARVAAIEELLYELTAP